MMDNKIHTVEDFYRDKLNWMPDNLKSDLGHFNVFRLSDFIQHGAQCTSYSRKEYFKISLVSGRNKYEYADKTIMIEDNALMFSNPNIPYNWERLDDQQSGYFCIFTEEFFQHFGAKKLHEYPVFRPGGQPIYFLSAEQQKKATDIFLRMFQEIESDYVYKYDVLRTLVFELTHEAMRMEPATTIYTANNAHTRISSLFMELLERQFPVTSPMQRMKIRMPVDFATQLAVHVNSLNRALKETTGKTTSQLIAQRILQEARSLLKHTDWSISEISWSLGFEELPQFIHFFKRNEQVTPGTFRR
ncbi:helix-turn-helix domain-containing protein [Chitinophaga sp. 30R24]|uniref:helix-turn-helix domain-containing protein n=1 Tax=Chitinophaga sp. 30R24 TaxID=3248838 RepID=UPI003B8EBFD2